MINGLNFTWPPVYNFAMKRWIYRWATVWWVVLWGVTAVSPTAVAQTSALTSQADVTYGKEILFHLAGLFAEPVAQVELFFTIGPTQAPFTVKANFAQDEAGTVTASYLLKREMAELPPFAEVRYWWVITTADAQTHQLPEATTLYRDDRFDWRSFADQDVRVYWTGSDAGLGQTAWEIVQESRQALDAILPPTAVSPLNVYIYPSTGDLRAGLRLAGRDVVDGHTDPALGVLLVTAVNPLTAAAELRQSIPHALTHLRLHQPEAVEPLPHWYEEGMAWLAAGPDAALDELVTTAVAAQQTLPLLQLCANFPNDPDQAELALAQSVSLLRSIQAQFGDQALRQLGSVYRSGASCEAGLTQTLDMSLVEINVAWLEAQTPQPAWLTFLTENGLWLLLVAGGFGLLVLILRR